MTQLIPGGVTSHEAARVTSLEGGHTSVKKLAKGQIAKILDSESSVWEDMNLWNESELEALRWDDMFQRERANWGRFIVPEMIASLTAAINNEDFEAEARNTPLCYVIRAKLHHKCGHREKYEDNRILKEISSLESYSQALRNTKNSDVSYIALRILYPERMVEIYINDEERIYVSPDGSALVDGNPYSYIIPVDFHGKSQWFREDLIDGLNELQKEITQVLPHVPFGNYVQMDGLEGIIEAKLKVRHFNSYLKRKKSEV